MHETVVCGFLDLHRCKQKELPPCSRRFQEVMCACASVSQLLARCVEWLESVMLFTQKPSASVVCPVLGVTPQIPKRPASWQDSRFVLSKVKKRSNTTILYRKYSCMQWFFFFSRANHQQKRQRSYRNSLLWQSLLLMPSTKQVNRTRPNQKLVSCQNAVGIITSVTVLHCFNVHQLYTVYRARQWSLRRALTGVGISVAITRLELRSAVSNTWVKTEVE